ncbi:MAG: DUF5011 domain-containing protein, partial [Opitutae bacterium]|nr:DUF5011 domain-containing protein [Opitutae bacterium]
VRVLDPAGPTQDTTKPVITLLGEASMTISVGDVYSDAGATAVDDTDGNLTANIVVAGADFDSNVPGDYTIRYNVNDEAGNAGVEVIRTVIVQESQQPPAPTIAIASITASGGNITVTINTPIGTFDHWHVSLDQPLAETGVAGGIEISSGLTHVFESVPTGNHTIYVGLADVASFLVSSVASGNVYVPKTDGPKLAISFGSAFEGSDGSIFTSSDGKALDDSNAGVLALGFFGSDFDESDAAIGKDIDKLLQNFVPLFSTNFDAVSAPGFLSTGGSVIADGVGQKPYVFLLSGVDDFSKAGSASEYGLYTDSGFSVLPDGGSPVPVDFSVNSMSYDTILLGKEIGSGGFGNGNAYASEILVVVPADTTRPTITLHGQASVTLTVGDVFTDAGATAMDDADGDLTANLVVTGLDIDTNVEGSYTIRYNVVDAAGNAAIEVSRTVVVEAAESEPDTTKPVITLLGDATVTLVAGNVYTDAGATAMDDKDGNLTANIVVTGGDFDSNVEGDYTIRYNVSDAARNAANEVTRLVTVQASEDNTSPEITSLSLVVSGSDVIVTLEATGNYDHWHLRLGTALSETGSAGGTMVFSNLTHTLTGVAAGEQTLYVGLVDASHALIGQQVSKIFSMPNSSKQVAAAYGSAFEGSSGSIFINSSDAAFDASTKGVLSLGFFNSGFDVASEAQANNLTGVLDNYNVLHSSSFTSAVAPGFLTTGGSVSENGVDKDPYIFLFAGVDDVADISSSTEFGLFSDSTFASIPAGGSPVPVDFSVASLTYDTVLFGKEVPGGGFAGANAYATLPVAAQSRGDEPPVLTLLGDVETFAEWETDFIDAGATALDFEDGDLTDEILVSGDEVDTFVAGGYTLLYSVMDSSGNHVSTKRSVRVERPDLPEIAAAGSGNVAVTYGSAFSGSDGSIFGSSDGTGFDADNKGTIALGYFDTGFDVATTASSQNITSLLAAFNVLHSSNFDEVAAPGFLGTGGSYAASGVGETPYIFLAAGITDFASSAEATQYGLFTDSAFSSIPDGGSPVPVDWSITSLTYDAILLGAEKNGGGFGSGGAFVTQTVSNQGGGDDDTTVPVITLTGEAEINHEAATEYVDDGATAADDTDGNLTNQIVVVGDDFNIKSVGVHEIKFNVADAAGNNALEVIRKVTVRDTTIPVITLTGLAEITINEGPAYSDAGFTAIDTLDGDVTAQVVVGGDTVNTAVVGVYTITFDVADASGNNAVQIFRKVTVQSVAVADTTPPLISLQGASEMTVVEGAVFTDPGVTATDAVDGDLSDKIVVGGEEVDTATTGVYTISYNVTDVAGNDAVEVTRKVTVQAAAVPDTTAPVIVLKGEAEMLVAQGSAFTDPGATATDDRDGDLSASVVIGGDSVDTFVAGIYNVTYDVKDAADNAASTVIRKVTVQAPDSIPPVITLKGQFTVYITQGDVYSDEGATALDARDGDVTSSITILGADFDSNIPSEYFVTYNVKDAAGNKAAEVTRKVVVDALPPPKFSIVSVEKEEAKVTVTISEPEGGAYDHWRLQLDPPLSTSGQAGGVKVETGFSHTFDNVTPGNHTVYVGLIDSDEKLHGRQETEDFVVLSTDGPKVSITFGSKFEGSDGVIFSSNDGTGFDNANPGTIAFGFFTPAFDLEKAVLRGDMSQILGNFNSLYTSGFNTASAPGFMTTGGAVTQNGIGSTPYILTMKGVADLALSANATEFGLFTDSGFSMIPEGGNPFPIEYDVTTMTYDTVVLGKTISSGGFGNANAYATAEVILSNVDVVPPEIHLKGGAEIDAEAGLTFIDPGYTANDDEEGDLSHLVVVGGSVNSDVPGEYTLSYNVSDTAGNAALEVERKVTVKIIDRLGPVITLAGDPFINLLLGDSFTDPGVSATDNIDGDVTGDIVITGAEIDTSVPGVHVIKYNVSDAAGNVANQVTRTIVVKTPPPPEITIESIIVDGVDATITIEQSGTFDHWHVSLDTPLAETGPAGGVMVLTPELFTHTFSDLTPGTKTIHVGLVNAAHELIGSSVSRTFTILETDGDKIQVTYGSETSGADQNLFEDSAGIPLSNAVMAFGFFQQGFDEDAASLSGNVKAIKENFQVLSWKAFIGSDPAGYLQVQEPVAENGVGRTPYILVFNGITDIADLDSATEYGLFNDSAWPIISTVADRPVYDISNLSFDTILLGDEVGGGGLGNANAYATQEVVPDTVPPVITLLGDNPAVVYIGEIYTDAGASAMDDRGGDISPQISIAGSSIDTSSTGNHIVTFNVKDAAGNSAIEVTRIISVVPAPASMPLLEKLEVNGNRFTLKIKTPDGAYDHWHVSIDQPFDVDKPLGGVAVSDGLIFTSNDLAPGTHDVYFAFADGTNRLVGDPSTIPVVILNTQGKKVQVTYGTATSGGSGSIFSNLAGVGFSSETPGIVAYGFFTPNFDVSRISARGDINELLSGFNILAWSNFDAAVSSGFLMPTQEHFENGVGQKPHVMTFSGVNNISEIDEASEFGLFTDTSLPLIPKGESPFPKAFGIARFSYDTIFLGNELSGKGSGAPGSEGPAYATQIVVPDTGVPTINLVGQNTITMEPGELYIDSGATATDPEQGDVSTSIIVSGADFDSNVPGVYQILFNVQDRAGNTAPSVIRTVTVVDTKAPVFSFLAGIEKINLNNPGTNYLGATTTASVIGDGDGAVLEILVDDIAGAISAINVISPGEGYTQATIIISGDGEDANADVVLQDLSQMVSQMGVPFKDPGVFAEDAFEGNLTSKVIFGGDSVDSNIEGIYLLNYTISDAAGNTSELVREVVVEDSLPPNIVLRGPGEVVELLIDDGGNDYTNVGVIIDGDGEGAYASAELNSLTGAVSRLIVQKRGFGYTYATVRFSGDGVGAKAKAVVMSSITNIIEASPVMDYVDPGAVAFDIMDGNMSAKLEVTGVENVDLAKPGEYAINYSVSDDQGNKGTLTRLIRVQDTTPPVLALTGTGKIQQVLIQNPGLDYTFASVTIDGDGEGAIGEPVVENGYVVGVNLLSHGTGYTFASVIIEGDGEGATAEALPDDGTIHTAQANSDANASFLDPGFSAVDTLDGEITEKVVVTGSDQVDLSVFSDYPIQYEISDAAGNKVSKARIVKVRDTAPPVITLAKIGQLESLDLQDGGTGYSFATVTIEGDGTDATAIALLNDQGAVSELVLRNHGKGYSFATVKIEGDGNGASATAKISDGFIYFAEADSTAKYVDPGVSAHDLFDGNITNIEIDASAVNFAIPGSYLVGYSATDQNGNENNNVRRTVIVRDNTSPELKLNGETETIVEAATTYIEAGAIALDAVDGDIGEQIAVGGDVVNVNKPGTYIVTYAVNDAAGNASTLARTVTVKDTLGPVISLKGPGKVTDLVINNKGSDYTFATITIEGDGSGAIATVQVNSISGEVTDISLLDNGVGYTYATVKIEGDGTGASAMAQILSSTETTVEAASVYLDAGAIAVDALDGPVSFIINNPVDTEVTGIYDVSYSASDAHGNETTLVRKVSVVDTTPPDITVYGAIDVTVEAAEPYHDLGAGAVDGLDGDLEVSVDNPVDVSKPGNYDVTYSVIDGSGNKSSLVRKVTVLDSENPEISLKGGSGEILLINVDQGGSGYTEAEIFLEGDGSGAFATAIIDVDTGAITGIEILSHGSGFTHADVFIDGDGVDAQASAVLDDGSHYFHEAATSFSEPGATAIDGLDGDISAQIVFGGNSVDKDKLGDYYLTYNVTDEAGNPAEERVRRVTVLDRTAPVISINGSSHIFHERGILFQDPGVTALDTLDGSLSNLIEVQNPVDVFRLGDYAITYDVTDSEGNEADQVVRLVSVVRGQPKETLFDFNGDGLMDDYVVISFTNDNWPSNTDVQFGDPYLDPIGDVNGNEFGTISGSVTDADGEAIPEFDVRILNAHADNPLTELVVYELTSNEDGTFVVKAPVGSYFLEAYGANPETGLNYEAAFWGGAVTFDESQVLTIEDSETAIEDVDLTLRQEYVAPAEKAPFSGNVIDENANAIEGAYVEFFPLDSDAGEEDNLLTDYPFVRIWTDSAGTFKTEIPNGEWGLIINHPSGLSEEVWVEAMVQGEPVEKSNIILKARPVATIEGSVLGPDGEAVVTGLYFMKRSGEDAWEPPLTLEFLEDPLSGELTGGFKATVPVGEYYVETLAAGLYINGFYTSTGVVEEFKDAEMINLTEEGLTGFAIELQKSTLVDVRFSVVDKNTGEPIEDITLGFFDSQEELEPAFYLTANPILPFDGSYVCRVPANVYRIGLFAPTHLSAFLQLDGEGEPGWGANAWWEASPIEIEIDEEYDLGNIKLSALPKDPSLSWYDSEGTGGGTLTGRVTSPSRERIPLAQVLLKSENGVLRMENTFTRPDGSFEILNLPAGKWKVWAKAPVGSGEFRHYLPSIPLTTTVTAGDTFTARLVLEPANVVGRLLYPPDRRNKDLLSPAENVPIWVYQDLDGNGLPDRNRSEGLNNEWSTRTDRAGNFALMVPPGNYILRISPPSHLGVLPPSPFRFEVTHPTDILYVGDAANVSWKSDLVPKGFMIERREGTGTYRRVHSGMLSPRQRTFFDNRRAPGRKYTYRLVAKLPNGAFAFPAGVMKPTQPFFALEPVVKTIAGMVVNRQKEVVIGAEVFARRTDGRGWNSTITEEDGSFLLGVGSGNIEVSIRSQRGLKAYWVYTGKPARFSFPHDKIEEQRSHNFIVEKTTATVNGRIFKPDGSSDWTANGKLVSIVMEDPKGLRGVSTLDSDGSFEIPLLPGNYEASFWLAPSLSDYNRPAPVHMRVKNGEWNLPDIVLTQRNSIISGQVTTSSSGPLENITVQAWNNRGERALAITDENGNYTLKVNQGKWEVLVEAPTSIYDEDDETASFIEEAPRRIKVRAGVTKTLDFRMAEILAYLEGDVIDSNDELVEDLEAWVYVRRKGASNYDFITEAEVDETSAFSVDLPAGVFFLGLWIDPDSGYTSGPEVEISVDDKGLVSLSGKTQVDYLTLGVVKNDAILQGTFFVDGELLTGVSGEVFAVKGDGLGGFYETPIEEDGTYSLLLPPGEWRLDYYLELDDESDPLPEQPAKPSEIIAVSGQTVVQNFFISPLSATISGAIHDENGTLLEDHTVYIWARRESSSEQEGFWVEAETDDGYFELNVETGSKYVLGAYLTPELRDNGYVEPKLLVADLTKEDSAELDLQLIKAVSNATISGIIKSSTGDLIENAFIYAWSDDGKVAGDAWSKVDGSYNLAVPGGVMWNVGSDYITINDETGEETAYITETELRVDLRSNNEAFNQNISLTEAKFTIPGGRIETFNPSEDFVLVLEDGTELRIPAGAVPVEDDVLAVTLIVQPFAEGLSKTVNDQPLNYGYSFELFDAEGQAITEDFNESIIIGVPYQEDDLSRLGIDIADVSLSFFSSTKNAWISARVSTVDSQAHKIFAQMEHFSSWAPSGPPGDSTIPVITITGDLAITHEATTSYTDAGATAEDDIDGDITDSIQTVNSVNINALGTYSITYNASDASGNIATEVTRSVTIIDNTPPMILLTGDLEVTHEAGEDYKDAGATAVDTLDGELTDKIRVTDAVDQNKPESYTVSFDVNDTAGNAANTITRTVTVVDTTPPSLSLLGEISLTHEVGTTYTDSGATASDIVDGDLTSNILMTNAVDSDKVGSYKVSIRITDSAGNTSSIERTVTVVDTVAPELTLNGSNTIQLEINSAFTDPGASAIDANDGTLAISVDTSILDTSKEGTYIVTYTATDAAGNTASLKRSIEVVWNVPVIIKENDVIEMDSGYYASTWFGPTYPQDANWLFHPGFGWIYVVGEDTSSLWIYDQVKGWFWTSRTTFPYIYVQEESIWYYFYLSSSNPRYFWNSLTEAWDEN